MNSIGQAIRRIRESKQPKMSQAELAKRLGLRNTAVSNWENGHNIPQAKDLPLIAKVLGVSINSLTEGTDLTKIDINPASNTHDIPFLSISAYATFVEMVGQHKFEVIEKVPVYFAPGEEPRDGQIVIEVTGSSMEPTIYEKSRVLFEEVPYNDIIYINSGIYAVVFDSQFVIKRVKENELLSKDYLTLYSDNPLGGSLRVPKNEIRKVWRAIDIVKQRLR
jgi:transcriptional regulator with XRE-family HTH domain